MADKKPLIAFNGDSKELPSGDLIPAGCSSISGIGTPTYDDVQDYVDLNQCSGVMEGCIVTENAAHDWSLDISAGKCFIKIDDSDTAGIVSFDIAQSIGVLSALVGSNIVYIDYNSGTPIFAITQSESVINGRDKFLMGRVFRTDCCLHILNSGYRMVNPFRKLNQLHREIWGAQRASGIITSESSTLARGLAVTSGRLWRAINPYDTTGIDTANKHAITAFDVGNKTFTVAGDHTAIYIYAKHIAVNSSDTMDGHYNVVSSSHSAGFTTVIVLENISAGSVAFGSLHYEVFYHGYLLNGVWNLDLYSSIQIDNVQYNDISSGGSEVLADVSLDNFGVHWVYVDFEGVVVVLYGQDNYAKLIDAQIADSPGSVPEWVREFLTLSAKIIIKRNAVSFNEVAIAWETPLSSGSVANHNDLGGLNDGDYKHLSAANNTDLTDGGSSALHYHATDRARANHTGTQLATTVSDFDSAALSAVGFEKEATLKAINKLVASVDAVAVYYGKVAWDDDPDWIEKCAWTSWYNETLNTSTRGATRKFPAEYLVIATSTTVTIYDATNSNLPMWMVFNARTVSWSTNAKFIALATITAVKVCNGELVVSGGHGVITVNFLTEKQSTNRSDLVYILEHKRSGSIALRNNSDGQSLTESTAIIISNVVNDIALTLLPDAPINLATGMRYVTIAAATDGGVSIIDGPAGVGTVVDLTCSNASYTLSKYISFRNDGALQFNLDAGDKRNVRVLHALPLIDVVICATGYGVGVEDEFYDPYDESGDLILLMGSSLGEYGIFGNYIGNSSGLHYLDPNPSDPSKGAVAYITKDYNTGLMHGDTQLATLADIVAGNVTTTIVDRCVQENHVTVTGTLTKAAVATGAELMGFSGFSQTNYGSIPYTSDFDFGTGNFCISLWAKITSIVTDSYFAIQKNGSTYSGNMLGLINSLSVGIVAIIINGNLITNTATIPPINQWYKVDFVRYDGFLYLYLNGNETYSIANTDDLCLIDENLLIGLCNYNNAKVNNFDGSLALFRISGTAPTPEQIKADYLAELPMFQEDAKCTLSGSSDSVLALDYDKQTENATVLTDVVDVFNGLVNTSQDTLTGIAQCVSVGDGVTVIGTSSQVTFEKPEVSLREELAKIPTRSFIPQQFRFTGDASETDFDLPSGYDVWAVYGTDGTLKLEGSGDDYEVEDNGNNKTVSFAAAPSAADFVVFGVKS